ncbi:IclR family transcriptional regulator [Agromyces sp. MMS24-K17]|uniref:IclR family transcriptional regulator n=1 Tax=Agromyces sp. MMS24-K17 TaxID=3372850 RepID=UPI003753F1AA
MSAAREEPGVAVGRGDRLALAFEVLELVAERGTGISANELARELGVARATVYRTVNSLVQQEFLLRRPDLTGFILGVRVLELASLIAAVTPSRERRLLTDLRVETGAVIHFARIDGERIELVDEDPACPLSDAAAFAAQPHRSAVGQLLLADLPPTRAQRLAGIPRDELVELAEATALRGYAEQIARLGPDRGCLAVPVRDLDGVLVGALALSAEPQRLPTAVRHVARLRAAAEELADWCVEAGGDLSAAR